jgi:hypothetical protein
MDQLKCNRCKVWLPISKFTKNRAERWLKSCNDCRLYQQNMRDKSFCIHGILKSSCNEGDCKGSQICIHRRQKSSCNEGDCKGSQICIHRRQKSTCKHCLDPIKITIKNWIMGSKQSDKKHNSLDLVNLIDTDFCKNLIEEYPNCIYCKIQLQYILYKNNLATIERVDNNIGHIKSNCKIACLRCNLGKVGNNIRYI